MAEEKRIYLFKIQDFPDQAFMDEEWTLNVMICPQDYFLDNHCQYDGHISHELREAGLLPDDFDEVAESAFIVCSKRTIGEVTADLLARGLIQDDEYEHSA